MQLSYIQFTLVLLQSNLFSIFWLLLIKAFLLQYELIDRESCLRFLLSLQRENAARFLGKKVKTSGPVRCCWDRPGVLLQPTMA